MSFAEIDQDIDLIETLLSVTLAALPIYHTAFH